MKRFVLLATSACVTLCFATAALADEHQQALFGLFLEERWDAIVRLARPGTTVNWWMWNGDENTNAWIDNFVAKEMKDRFGIRVRRVGVSSPEVFMQRMREDYANNVGEGRIDLIWVNGENFKTAREKGLLWGPFAQNLPNVLKYVDMNAPDIAYDFGYPTQGFETVYSRAQLVLIYDSARVPNPPKNVVQLARWVRANPGRFTYPQVSDHTGSAFVRNIFYHTNSTGGYKAFLYREFDKELLENTWSTTWTYLNGIKPHLWKQGREYPENLSQLDDLFAKGEVDFTISYSPNKAAALVKQHIWPETVRVMVLEEGTLRNANFVAIPFNAPNKAAAMVLANFIASPAFQISSGTMMGIEFDRLAPNHKAIYDKLQNVGPYVPPIDALNRHALPELQMEYVVAIDEGWRRFVQSAE